VCLTLSGKERPQGRDESTLRPRGRSFASLDDARARLIGGKLGRSAWDAAPVSSFGSTERFGLGLRRRRVPF